MRRLLVVLALLAAVACGREEPRYGSDGSRSQAGPLSSVIDRCRTSPEPVADPVGILAAPGAWVRVDSVAGREKGAPVAATSGSYLVLGGDPAMVERLPGTVGSLRMPGTVADSTRRALRLGAAVTVKTGLGGDPRTVSIAVATLGGDIVFLGDCAQDSLGGPAHAAVPTLGLAWPLMVGQESAEVRRLAGLGHLSVRFLLEDSDTRSLSEQTPDELLAPYRPVWVTVRGDAAWDAPARLCLHVELGRSACVHLNGTRTSAARIRGWYDPAGRTELRLYDAKDARLLATVGTVDVPRLARRAGFDPVADGVVLRVDLAASPSYAEVLADPRAARRAVSLRVAPCAVHDCPV